MVFRRARNSVVIVATAALIGALVVPVASSASAIPSDTVTAPALSSVEELPPLDSPAPKEQAGSALPAPLEPDPDMPLDASAAEFDIGSSTLIGRKERLDQYETASGKTFAVASVLPKNVKDPVSKEWVPMSSELSKAGTGVEADDHPLAPEFAAKADATSLVTVNRDGYSMSVGLVGAAASAMSSKSAKDEAEVEYAAVLPTVDLAYQLDGASLTEQLVLDAAPTSAPSYTWRYTAPGLTAGLNERGVLDFTDKVRWESGWHFKETRDAIWADISAAHSSMVVNRASIRQQFDCHVLGGIAGGSVGNPTWDLEYSRPFNEHWLFGASDAIEARDPGLLCNWVE